MSPRYWLSDLSTWFGLVIACGSWIAITLGAEAFRASPYMVASVSAMIAALLTWPLSVYLKINPIPMIVPLLLIAAIATGIVSIARSESYSHWLLVPFVVAAVIVVVWTTAWRSMM